MPIKLRPFWIHAPKGFQSYTKAVAHPQILNEAIEDGLSVALGQYLGLVHGKGASGEDNPLPAMARGSGLMRPKAIFKGVKRMLRRSWAGEGIFCYVTNPGADYRLDIDFANKNPHLPDMERLKLSEIPSPQNSAFVTFVSTESGVLDEIRDAVHDPLAETQAVVLGWEWTLAMPDGSGLPFDHHTRYESRLL